MMPRGLFFTNWFEPGFKGGGSQLAAVNHVNALKREFQFQVVTRDRDLGSIAPYAEAQLGSTKNSRGVMVRYLSPNECGYRTIAEIIEATEHEFIHLNSVFSTTFSIFPLLARSRSRTKRSTPIIISPHGELAPSARAQKRKRKAAYLKVANFASLFRGATWHATSKFEEKDLRELLGESATIMTSPVFPTTHLPRTPTYRRKPKTPGQLRVVFLSRIDRIKNLDLAIDLIDGLQGVTLDIYGPNEQRDYWSACLRKISMSTRPEAFQYRGSVEPDEVLKTISDYDLFLLPSEGESFGYVILEALSAGCPVLISDRTPWRDLESKGVGYVSPLKRIELFRTFLSAMRDLDEFEHSAMRARARQYALDYDRACHAKQAMRTIYEKAISDRC